MKKLPYHDFSGNIIVRLLVGLVFLSEGVQKFLFPGLDGVGRFMKIGIPDPAFFGPFVGSIEIVCGCLLIIGLFTRAASVPLMMVILTAIYTTKIPTLTEKGFWAAAHDGRADFCMLMGLIFLLIYGAGKFSADSKLFGN
ncbi:putative membrane protein YphA (DoxX/SURF4 family) [Mucilaginibacter frigoritolerans]|uniref:Putative membrane protein YphA (DoxX/SURF4 family) n=1 Tax=Mucilaginibacter frigoritolerans TaxID=652788 RepID=A0A562UBZ6_9SPHI|nr:DoxX family protein [Mucilaginibacter frigoritolerans]TWJ03333.1 putative membrane protein YphA (DoxX/SURF4 family) [Mucilaginibacter frigoritolerans]